MNPKNIEVHKVREYMKHDYFRINFKSIYLLIEFIGEIVEIFTLIYLGCGVVAGTLLKDQIRRIKLVSYYFGMGLSRNYGHICCRTN